ncbi:photosystem II reaction center PSB28 protein, chloroplastic isoform X2 [Vigna radiata var. radiata]|uniref:Photosystem II reaction center Psb28 protein n=1 Tax=Vigna radiata var. radiata TaxID=3916 RepID=A0A3Q0EXL6_VIGRR|nr:photosystem II reaction center PSB28 protein, chloroplastic isoform X2 [Vigna radiata var. radiata]
MILLSSIYNHNSSMAASFHSLTFFSSLSSSVPPMIFRHSSTHSSFNGQSVNLPRLRLSKLKQNPPKHLPAMMMAKPTIQFIRGTDEQTIPDVKLTTSRDGTNGVLQSVDVSAKFVNGKPSGIEAKYVMRTPKDWDRFMRFMERYSDAKGLQFIKK